MIYCLFGDNIYKRQLEIDRLAGAAARHFDGIDLTPGELRAALASQSLFGDEEAVVLQEPSANTDVWGALPEVADGSETTLIIVEQNPDKRTKTYKWLRKHANVIDCTSWTARDRTQATTWTRDYAERLGVKLTTEQITTLVDRATYASDNSTQQIDQQRLATVLEQLSSAAQPVDDAAIDAVIAPSASDSVFELLGAALRGDSERVRHMAHDLRGNEDGYKIMGLLASQATQVVALATADGRSLEDVAQTSGAHPYGLRSLRQAVGTPSASQAAAVVASLALADEQIKHGADPWDRIETALIKIARTQ